MQPINLMAYAELARASLDASAWDYFEGGSDDEVTLRANRSAFEHIRLRPRVLVDVGACDLATSVLGTPVSLPILAAPLGCQAMAHPAGECAMARGVGAAGSLMVASTMSNYSLEEIAQTGTPLWFQLYIYRDRAVTAGLIQRAEQAGYRALVITVDTPRLGKRERDMRNGFGLPPHLRFANFASPQVAYTPATAPGSSGLARHTEATFDDRLTWDDIGAFSASSRLPIILKGILTAEDARMAVEHGVAGVVVSNHGGRQLDGVPATIEALPEVAEAVQGRCELYLDGGIRRGTDVLKALALGARAVLLGRPLLWGLAAAGEDGVRHVLDILREELGLALALAGRPSLANLDRSCVGLTRG